MLEMIETVPLIRELPSSKANVEIYIPFESCMYIAHNEYIIICVI
jgi:hypothetical protein